MQTIMLDGRLYQTPGQLHKALQTMLQLPAYYGMNADALYDCLSEHAEPVNVWVLAPAEGEAAPAFETCLHVFQDLGGKVTLL